MLDGSNDTGIDKIFPVTVKLFDVNFSRAMTKFLDLNIMEGKDTSTAVAMIQRVDNLFSKFNL